jgi:hypothetical protein
VTVAVMVVIMGARATVDMTCVCGLVEGDLETRSLRGKDGLRETSGDAKRRRIKTVEHIIIETIFQHTFRMLEGTTGVGGDEERLKSGKWTEGVEKELDLSGRIIVEVRAQTKKALGVCTNTFFVLCA